MKWLVWLLLLINIGLAVYFNTDFFNQHQSLIKPDVSPNKVTLLDSQALAAMPKKTVLVGPSTEPSSTSNSPTNLNSVAVQAGCYEWGIFSKNNLAAAKTELNRLALSSSEKKQTSQEAQRFWVYIPPLKSAALAQTKVEELKALGIQDTFIVQEPQWRNAISFGVFQDEKLATNLLNELKSKGVSTATKNLRNQGREHVSFLLKDVSAAAAAELANMKARFPGSEIKSVDCKAGV